MAFLKVSKKYSLRKWQYFISTPIGFPNCVGISLAILYFSSLIYCGLLLSNVASHEPYAFVWVTQKEAEPTTTLDGDKLIGNYCSNIVHSYQVVRS